MTKTTRRAFLSSVVSLIICLTMLIGTTFAWFTDTASTAVNTIQSGTLDVVLEMKDSDGNWVRAEGETLNFVAADGRTEILWEPGCTYETPELRIRNNGNLALKYKVIISGINGDAKLNDVIDWYYSIELSSVIPGATGWTTPSDAYKLENFGDENYLYPAGVAANARTDSQVFKIIGRMDENAGNEYQSETIEGIAITVYATQYTYEYDSENNTYDAEAEYPEVEEPATPITAAELAKILCPDGYQETGIVNVTLDKNYILTDDWTSVDYATGTIYQQIYPTVVIDGNGHYIAGLTAPLLGADAAQHITVKNLTIKDSDIKGGTSANATSVGAIIGFADNFVRTLEIENCHTVNVKVSTQADGDAGSICGYVYMHDSDEVSEHFKMTGCTVTGGSVTNAFGNAAGLVGFLATNPNGENPVIENCKVENCNISGETDNKTGQLVGTVNNRGTLYINNCTYDTAKSIIGRNSSGGTKLATVLVDGTEVVK